MPPAAAQLETALVEAIARAEKSVVAIARVRREQPGETFRLEFRPDAFGRRPLPLAAAAAHRSEFRAQRVRHGRGGRPPRA